MIFRTFLSMMSLPGIFAVAVPLLIAWLDPLKGALWGPALVVIALGASLLLSCARDFLISGKGTPAPWDPPKSLVVTGLYGFVRNPMYISVLVLVFGWAGFFSAPLVLIYTAILGIAFHVRVIKFEEPALASQFGAQWRLYIKNVPRWIPRFKPWREG